MLATLHCQPGVAVIVETCPLILVTTLLLVVKHSTILSVVTGLVVVWVSLAIDAQLFGCDNIKTFCCGWGEQLIITIEDDFGTTVETSPEYKQKLENWNIATVANS